LQIVGGYEFYPSTAGLAGELCPEADRGEGRKEATLAVGIPEDL
jgi:hypothetical protein